MKQTVAKATDIQMNPFSVSVLKARCEQQLDMGQTILKDRCVVHTQAVPRILKGNEVDILQPGRG